jgi:DNA-binding transcriptional MerR regulator
MAEYKIKDLEVLTGIKAHTIRIWEKRYGILIPERTDTKIRLYSDEELTLLLNVALLNNSGVKISRIAVLSRDQIKDKVWEVKGSNIEDNSIELMLLALLDIDECQFKNVLEELIASIGIERMFSEKLIPFLDRIGVMWLVGSITTAQEHFISNLIRQKLISELDKLPVPQSKTDNVLLFLPEHEWHEISLLYYHYVLRRNGRNTFYLGQSLPYDALLESVEKLKPSALVTSWLTAVDQKFIVTYFDRLQQDVPNIPIYSGGYQMKEYGRLLGDKVKIIEHTTDLQQLY